MKTVKEYIESGILESYILGITDPAESAQVEQMAAAYDEIRVEINMISQSIENYATLHAIDPPVTVRPFLLATIDYTERMKNGEPVSMPPILHEHSSVADYTDWLKDKAATTPADFNSLHARIIGYTPDVITAIVWIKEFAAPEVHTDELEKFLIVEGTCNITIGEELHQLVPGDVLSIPLYISHRVEVTSKIPCKVILQRIAA
jgi:mannose-6-phosphate isomerase-like protein (cupin superfamily)